MENKTAMSTEPSVEIMNGVIGVFMGFTKKTGALPIYKVPIGEDLKYQAFSLHVKNMPYHTDYNWLHSAWVRFRDLEIDGNKNVPDLLNYQFLKGALERSILNEPIAEAHKALYDAICWYNSIKK